MIQRCCCVRNAFCFVLKTLGERYDSIDQLGTLAPLSWIDYRWPLSQLCFTASRKSVQRAVGHFVYPYVVEQSQQDLISYNTSHYYCKSIAFYLLYVPNLFIQLCLMFTLYFRPFIIASFTVFPSTKHIFWCALEKRLYLVPHSADWVYCVHITYILKFIVTCHFWWRL